MGKKSKGTHSISNGGRKKSNLAHEAKRQAKFAAKRGTDKEYKYEPIPYEKGSREYNIEKTLRAIKARSSKLPFAQWKSFITKVQNELDKKALEDKKKFDKTK